MSHISPLRREHVGDVASLHQLNLPGSLSGRAGRHLLECYYRALPSAPGCTAYVAEEQSVLLGFVCGVWDSRALRSYLVRTELLSLVLWGVMYALSSPTSAVRRLTAPRGRAESTAADFELRPIVVAERARGTGLATALTERLLEDARTQGFSRIFLYTEPENVRARRLYEKCGFSAEGVYVKERRTLLRYVRDL